MAEQSRKNPPVRSWPELSRLFPRLDADRRSLLDRLPKILEQIRPLNKSRRDTLPGDVRELSSLLTSGRGELKRPYWIHPAFVSAYLYYFLPWNLIRLTRLFSGLSLPDPDFAKKPLLLDAGSGPLTLPIALWLAKPDWRVKPLSVLALDSSRQPLELGAKILAALSAENGVEPWSLRTVAGPVDALYSAYRKNAAKLDASPWLVSGANILNELRRGRNPRRSEEDDEKSFLTDLLESWGAFREYDSFKGFLFVEPGTRLGGDTIMELREAANDLGYAPASPCAGADACPLLRRKSGKSGGLSASWCHFTFAADDAPRWLENLSAEAGLAKKTLSLSFLLLSTRERRSKVNPFPCRVLSQPFAVPGVSPACRYGCAAPGLCLLPDSRSLASGDLTLAVDAKKRDARGQALIIEPATPKKTKF